MNAHGRVQCDERMSGLDVEIDGVSRRFDVASAIVVGRSPTADMTVDDPMISNRHLLIERGPAGWVAKDLGSTNGTFRDGLTFHEGAIGSDWSTLRLGGAADGV